MSKLLYQQKNVENENELMNDKSTHNMSNNTVKFKESHDFENTQGSPKSNQYAQSISGMG
jgi:hypothetical protein